MANKIYIKNGVQFKIDKRSRFSKIFIKISGISLTITGISIIAFFVLPVLIFNLLNKSIFEQITSPIPYPFILTPEIIFAIEKEQNEKTKELSNNKSTNTYDWLLKYNIDENKILTLNSYYISIPKLNINKAKVSTKDTDLTKSLVQHTGTPIPPLPGNTVIFGHSSLPQLFTPHNYNTILTNAQNLKVSDEIIVHLNSENIKYKVVRIFVTDPDDLTVLNQNEDASYLTIITCTPPGTIWKRLIIKARIVINN